MAKKKSPTDAILLELRAFGLAYPGAHLKSPWPGHMDLAVNDKTFAYLSVEGEPLGVGCKLPRSAALALMLPGATPMAYGLGKSGWVSLSFEGVAPADIDVDMLKAWLDESYRAQAPKSFVKKLAVTPGSATAASPAPARSPRSRRAAAKRSAGASGRGDRGAQQLRERRQPAAGALHPVEHLAPGLRREVARQHRVHGVAPDQHVPGQHLVRDARRRVDVRRERLELRGLLGPHLGRAVVQAAAARCAGAARRARNRRAPRVAGRLAQHDVRRLHVEVRDVHAVHRLDAGEQVVDDRERASPCRVDSLSSVRSRLMPRTNSIARIGLGRALASNVTKRAMFGCAGSASSAPASSRNSASNSCSDRLRARRAAVVGHLERDQLAVGAARARRRAPPSSTEPPAPRPIGRTT